MNQQRGEFLLISEAVARLVMGMFGGGIKRPELVAKAKQGEPRTSFTFGPHREAAAEAIDQAINSGDLSVHVFPVGEDFSLKVPLGVLGKLIRSRGGLPDHVARLPVQLLADGSAAPNLFTALSKSALYLRRDEFEAWYKRRRSRGRWPSQRKSKKPRVGRPSKQTEELRISILARVAEGSWTGAQGIAPLMKLLAPGHAAKRDTLRRAVNQIFKETGDVRCRVVPRLRRKSA